MSKEKYTKEDVEAFVREYKALCEKHQIWIIAAHRYEEYLEELSSDPERIENYFSRLEYWGVESLNEDYEYGPH